MNNYIVFIDDPPNTEFFIKAGNEKQARAKAKKKYPFSKIVSVIEDTK